MTDNRSRRFLVGTGLCILAALLIPTCSSGAFMTVVVITLAVIGFFFQVTAWSKSYREFKVVFAELQQRANEADRLRVKLTTQQLRLNAFVREQRRRRSERVGK